MGSLVRCIVPIPDDHKCFLPFDYKSTVSRNHKSSTLFNYKFLLSRNCKSTALKLKHLKALQA
jgi:hypothetical protein